MSDVSDARDRAAKNTVLKVSGWVWCVVMTLVTILLISTGGILAGCAYGISAFLAAPPSWRILTRFGVRATRQTKAFAVFGASIAGGLILASSGLASVKTANSVETDQQPTASKQSATTSKPPASKSELLKAMTAKIADIALQPLDRKYNPEGYAKLGKAVWDKSNDLRLWAGIAALQNSQCKFVSAIAVWEQATPSQLSWHVVCGDERFIISEAQAENIRAQFDPKMSDADRAKYSVPVGTARPMSAAFAGFDPKLAIAHCETAMKDAAVNRGSLETSGIPYL